MSANTSTHPTDAWWITLGLHHATGLDGDQAERQLQRAKRDYLSSVRPSGFLRATTDGETTITIDQITEELAELERESAAAAQDAVAQRQKRGWSMVRTALSASDAEMLVEDGDWAGFTRGIALAWCWNLYQYEPRGFTHPASRLRMERTAELEAGLIPNGFGYAARASALEAAGFTPETYRWAQEALGKPIFSPGDIRH